MVTELRVHGVSGTPVESTLDRPLLHRVAGDADAGFHRPRPAYGDTTGPGGAALEGYRWGNLTAGAAARAMWLLLLPFMLANVTMWLRPPAGHRGTLLTRALCRVFGLSVTATFVLALAGVSLDLVAWQCATPGNPCATGRSYLRFLTEMPTGRRLAVLAVVPIAVLAFLWFLARRTWARYEAYPLPETADGDGLAAAGFWAGMAQVGRLRSIHLAAACGTLAALLGWAVAGHDRDWPGYLLAIAATGLLAACALALCLTGMVSRDRPAGWADRAATGLRTAGFLLVGLVLVNAAWARGPWYATGGLPGYGLSVTTLFAGQSVLLLALGVVVFVQSRQTTPRPPLYGLAGPVLGSVAVGVSVAFTAGVSYRVADFLDRGAVPTPSGYGPARPLQPPAAYEWTAFGFVVLVVVAILVAVLARVRLLGRLRAAAAGTTDHDFPHGRTRDPARAAAIDTAIADAQLADHSGRLLALAYVPLAIAAAVVTGFALAGTGPVELARSGTPAAKALSFTTNLGTYLIGIAALALLVLGVLAYRYPGIRRVVGVLWDLGTFWPRAAHPLAPPCYAERVVPELVTRASWLAEREGVVLSGHSQGSVLVFAAALQLPARVMPRVALITYGSPLRRLYARLFPAYVDAGVLGTVATAVGGRWWNLWRDTDPIGGQVGAPGPVSVDWRLRDPAAFDVEPGDTVYPHICGHSGYQQDPIFAVAVTDLVSRLSAPEREPEQGPQAPRREPAAGAG